MEDGRIFGVYRGLPKSIYVLFVVRIVNALGAFVGPFLTMFLSDKIGLSSEVIGVFIMLNSFASLPGAMIGGKIADSLGRKRVLTIFQSLAALCFVPCAFLGYSIAIPFLLVFATFFNSIAQPAYGAMIADLTNTENRNSAYSLLYLGNNLGFSVGPMIAGFLYSHYLKMIFIGNSIAVFTSIFIIYKFIKETKPDKEAEVLIANENEKVEEGSLFSALFKRPLLMSFALLSVIYSFVYAQYPFCIPLQMKEIFKSNSSVIYGYIMATNGVTVILLTTVLTKITRKLSAIQNVALAGVFYGIGFGMMYFIHTFPLFIVATVLWTIGEIFQSTNSGVYIANHTPMSHRGRFNAVIPLITGSGFAFGPLLMGIYIKNRRVIDAWPVTSILSISAAILFYILYIRERRKVRED
ncbi:MDR family MFS transporter [Clostridium omnivorum]|uniref:MFS transporter n=1 Tax=Clostridium omnivorum TaxID=1604902 RepID=A0ABQ5N1G9_9CLOT|nr:MFS transporter [Clostridium sp. E14]GLC28915.1 MFS transporter [Clostridium sp. E14]